MTQGISPTFVVTGPTMLPLAVTQLVSSESAMNGGAETFPSRNFDLRDAAGNVASFRQAQAYLYKTRGTSELTDDAVIALGSTGLSSDRIKVRGAEEGDRLCIFRQ